MDIGKKNVVLYLGVVVLALFTSLVIDRMDSRVLVEESPVVIPGAMLDALDANGVTLPEDYRRGE